MLLCQEFSNRWRVRVSRIGAVSEASFSAMSEEVQRCFTLFSLRSRGLLEGRVESQWGMPMLNGSVGRFGSGSMSWFEVGETSEWVRGVRVHCSGAS